jgi:hypothetical protein
MTEVQKGPLFNYFINSAISLENSVLLNFELVSGYGEVLWDDGENSIIFGQFFWKLC